MCVVLYTFIVIVYFRFIHPFIWLAASGWRWFVLKEKYYWLVDG
jgi:hypothetical protein